MTAENRNQESFRPVTVAEHRMLADMQAAKKQTAVDDALQFPNGAQFEAAVDELLKSDAESRGEVIAIALVDLDEFDHINKDFSREEGDRVIIAAGRYLQEHLPAEASIFPANFGTKKALPIGKCRLVYRSSVQPCSPW